MTSLSREPWPAPCIYGADQVKPRELWQPNEVEQLDAAETLLKRPIPSDLREVLRSFHETLDQRKAA